MNILFTKKISSSLFLVMVMMMMMMLMIQGEAAPAKNHRFRRIDHTAKFSPEGCWGLATQLTADPNYQASYMASMNFQIDGQCTVDPNARPDFTSCTSTLNMVTNMFSKGAPLPTPESPAVDGTLSVVANKLTTSGMYGVSLYGFQSPSDHHFALVSDGTNVQCYQSFVDKYDLSSWLNTGSTAHWGGANGLPVADAQALLNALTLPTTTGTAWTPEQITAFNNLFGVTTNETPEWYQGSALTKVQIFTFPDPQDCPGTPKSL